MKLKSFLLVLMSLHFGILFSQVPKGFNYQAVIRDGLTGNPLTEPVDVRFTIRSDSVTGTVFWVEEHYNVDPDDNGLFSLVVGKGTRISGLAKFSDIDWTTTPKYLMMDINDGTWEPMGSTRLWSVPYALVADSLGGPLAKLAVKGSTTSLEEPLFEVKNNSGQTVFAVYNEGVRIYVDNGAKGSKGGFAVSGFGLDKDAIADQYFYVSRDSVRVYLDSDPLTKAVKGGFAVSGFDFTKGALQKFLDVNGDSVRVYIDQAPSTKAKKGGFAVTGFVAAKAGGVIEDYLRVTRDSTRVLVNENASKAVKGGFAVSGFDYVKGYTADPFTSLTPQNYFIGHRSGAKTSSGIHNSFVGYESGFENTTGRKNVFLGYHAGYSNDTASYNVFIGNEAGKGNANGRFNTFLGYQSGHGNDADYNVFLGYQSGFNNSSGKSNTFLGHLAGFQNLTGDNNVFLGDSAGYTNQGGKQNIFLGNGSGKANNGDYNAFIGYQAGFKNNDGTHNAFIGYQAGRGNLKGKNNIFIGYKAGYSNTGDGTAFTGNSNVYIGDQTGLSNTTGYSNVYIGQEAGKSTVINPVSPPVYNVYIGYQSGFKEYEGTFNTFVGYQTGYENYTGDWNTFIGFQSGYKTTNGSANSFIGYQAGYSNTLGNYNAFIGYHAGRQNTQGYRNTSIGFKAGYSAITGSYNVMLGNNAGYYETGSRRYYVSVNRGINYSQGIDSSLIYGEFDNQIIRLNKIVGIGLTPTVSSQALEVSGNGRFTSLAGSGNRALYVDPNGILTTSSSDSRLKESILPIAGALAKVNSLNGITYSWRDDPQKKRYIGFIAQDVESVIPELVFTDPVTGIKGINYAEMTAVLAESVKEQQLIINEQQQMIRKVIAQNESITERIKALEDAIKGIVPAYGSEKGFQK